MSLVPPSIRRLNADMRYESAVLELLELHQGIPKSTQTRLAKVSYPTPQQQDTVSDRTKFLERAIDDVLQYSLKDQQKKKRISEIVVGWFRASYPFANIFLRLTKDGASISVLNPCGLICGALLILTKAMFEESRMAKDIDEKLDYLSTTIHRLEIIDDIPADIHDARLDKLNCAALNLAASILEYLILALEHFNKPPKCEALSLSSIGLPNVAVLVRTEGRIVHSSREFDKAVNRIDNALVTYIDMIRGRNPMIIRLLSLLRRFW